MISRRVSNSLIRLAVVLVVLVSAVLLQSELSVLFAQAVTFSQTETGFVWPLGRGHLFDCTGGTWLGRDRVYPGSPRQEDDPWVRQPCSTRYEDRYYHIGFDMLVSPRTAHPPVFAISYGVVVERSTSGWGSGNSALLIKHKLWDDYEFLALYGHIRTNLQRGDRVSGGVEIGTVGDSYCPGNCNHLHFGIVPETRIPPTDVARGIGWGRMTNNHWSTSQRTNGFIDPVDWITWEYPKCENGTSERYRLPGGRPPRHPNGSLIKVAGPPDIYVLQDDRARKICCPERLWALYSWMLWGFWYTDVIIVAQDELNQYLNPPGADVFDAIEISGWCEPPGRLIQQWDSPEISIVTGDCVRRPFATPEAFLRLGYSACNVWPIGDYYDSYAVGPPIRE